MQYGEVVDSMLAVLPETKSSYDELQAEIGPDVLPHMIVELMLRPFVKDLLGPSSNKELRRRAFGFLENMACSRDIDVVNLLQVGIFEAWVGEPTTLKNAWKHMGESTRRIATDTAHGLSCGKNLPS